jgi:hypothetical protein
MAVHPLGTSLVVRHSLAVATAVIKPMKQTFMAESLMETLMETLI